MDRRSAALMRACQPGPMPRKCASTSLSRRIEIACFFAVPGGRPRRTTLRPTMTSASSNHDLPSAGASSGSRQARFEERFFSTISLPHRNDPPRVAARRPHHDHDIAPKAADGDKAGFAIVPPIIRARHVHTIKKQSSQCEIKATLLERHRALDWIESDAHELSYIR